MLLDPVKTCRPTSSASVGLTLEISRLTQYGPGATAAPSMPARPLVLKGPRYSSPVAAHPPAVPTAGQVTYCMARMEHWETLMSPLPHTRASKVTFSVAPKAAPK